MSVSGGCLDGEEKMRTLTKSDYLEYRDCWKSFWLRLHKPEAVARQPPSPYDRLLMADGYAVESLAIDHIRSLADGERYEFQVNIVSPDGLSVRVDAMGGRDDGSYDLVEIKSSTSIAQHMVDICFQVIAAEHAGLTIASASIMHIDKDYRRGGTLDPGSMFRRVDVSEGILGMRHEIEADIAAAREVVGEKEIDERHCDCRTFGRGRHCEAFDHFNPGLSGPTAYMLPRISASRLRTLNDEDRLIIDAMGPEDVTTKQLPVLNALRSGEPQIDQARIRSFLSGLTFPLHFYDYETFASAIPAAPGFRPHMAMPVQFSVYVLQADGSLTHSEFLADRHDAQASLVSELRENVGDTGDVIVWNESFEKACNVRMTELLPTHADFLEGVNDRTVDLMVPFKEMYVDPRFEGSVSIKKVLPALCPELDYSQGEVSDGASAMAAFAEMLATGEVDERERLRNAMTAYCRLDTLAMVRILQFLQRV
jgi:hypothetical protein